MLSNVFQDTLILTRILHKLYNIQTALSEHASAIRDSSRQLVDLNREREQCEEEHNTTRAAHARAKTVLSREEKRVKRAEKALEGKRPELVEVEAQIAHATRKRDNAEKIAEQVTKDADRQRARLEKLERDLDAVRRAANEATGVCLAETVWLSILTRDFRGADCTL